MKKQMTITEALTLPIGSKVIATTCLRNKFMGTEFTVKTGYLLSALNQSKWRGGDHQRFEMSDERLPLTRQFIMDNIGKTIEWFAFGYRGNAPYAGSVKIKGLTADHRCVDAEVVKGEEPFFWSIGDQIVISDCYDVFVGREFTNYTIQYDVPKHGYTRAGGNPFNYGLTVDANETLEQVVARKLNVGNEYTAIAHN